MNNMSDKNYLHISEDFYSVQGEGISSGVPSYFIRLFNCNLSCGASKAFMKLARRGQEGTDAGEFQGDLHAEGKATWTCDTIPVWVKGNKKEFQYLVDRWQEQGIFESIMAGTIRLIWTGGEPALPIHQECIHNFLIWLNENYGGETWNVYSEIETNGTQVLNDDMFSFMDQINSSPKLSNSGHTPEERIVPEAINRIMEHSNYQFKFVISTEDDIREMFEDFIMPFDIPLTNVVCMPGLDAQEDFHERTRWVMEMAIKYKFRGLTRLHVSAWDKTTGV